MKCIQDKDMVKAFLSDSSNPTFGKRIGIGCIVGCVNNMKSFGLKDDIKRFAELGIIIVDQETERRFTVIKFPN